MGWKDVIEVKPIGTTVYIKKNLLKQSTQKGGEHIGYWTQWHHETTSDVIKLEGHFVSSYLVESNRCGIELSKQDMQNSYQFIVF